MPKILVFKRFHERGIILVSDSLQLFEFEGFFLRRHPLLLFCIQSVLEFQLILRCGSSVDVEVATQKHNVCRMAKICGAEEVLNELFELLQLLVSDVELVDRRSN